MARQKIERIEYRAALQAGSRYAYRTFMKRHPGSKYALGIKRKLEDLDFETAKSKKNQEALGAFLRQWPKGRHAGSVRSQIESIECQRLAVTEDPSKIIEALRTQPQIACRASLRSRQEELTFKQALESLGVRKLYHFLENYPKSKNIRTAKKHLVRRQFQALVQADAFEAAKRHIDQEAFFHDSSQLRKQLEVARELWLAQSLDPALIRKQSFLFPKSQNRHLRKWAVYLQKHRARYRQAAAATARLRALPQLSEAMPLTQSDPRQRWLEVRKASRAWDEETADILLKALDDSNLEVRRSVLLSLPKVLATLGPIRSESWLMRKLAKVGPRARAGRPLIKHCVLLQLAGRQVTALEKLENHLAGDDGTDLFAAALAAEIALDLGLAKKAATLTAHLSAIAADLGKQRRQIWKVEDLSDSEVGWLTLRQLYGIQKIWISALAPYLAASHGSGHSDFHAVLGDWLSRASADLAYLLQWFEEQEARWASRHPKYQKCGQQAGEEPIPAVPTSTAFSLAFANLPEASATAKWVACCYPDAQLRDIARAFCRQNEWLSQLAPLWPELDFRTGEGSGR